MLGVHDSPDHARAQPRYPAPVSARRALAVIEMLRLPRAARILDVAAGSGGLLLDAVALHDGSGLGLVSDESEATSARAAAEREGLAGRADFTVATPGTFAPERRFDAILCVRPTPAPRDSFAAVAVDCFEWLRVGGVLLVGEPFLRRPPAPRYRALLGDAGAELAATGARAGALVAAGFELKVTVVCSESEWDAHESARYRAALREAANLTDESAARAVRERAEAWYHAYWRYGRDTLGFAFQAYGKPRSLRAIDRS
jgi:SAM-dependent methyltransferase